MTKREKIALVLIVQIILLLILITACLWVLDTQMAALADDLEQFKQETYDRERSLLSANVPDDSSEIFNDIYDQVSTGNDQVDEDYTLTDINVDNNDVIVPDEVYFDENYVLRVLTAEAGSDEALCGCVAQALYNACEKEGWEYTPVEILHKYGYTSPASWISDAAVKAYDEVFLSGVTYTDIGKALYFYAPRYCDSPWHESQRFVTEVSGVRFFEEWD